MGWMTVRKPEVSGRLTVIYQGIWSERRKGKAASVLELWSVEELKRRLRKKQIKK